MSRRDAIRARGGTGRADLLRLLAIAPRNRVTLDCDASGWFGYVRGREPPPQPARIEVVAPSPGPTPVQERRLPLRLPFVPAIVRREPRQPQQPDAASEEAFAHAAAIDENAAGPPSEKRLIAYEDLVPQARLLPALRRALGASRAGPLDLERLTQLLAASQLPRHLPRRIYRRWHPDLVVLLDFSPRLWPYRWDMHRLAERLLRQAGRVSVRIANHGPYGPWSDWLAHQNRQSDAEPAWQMWKMPPVGTPVLIVSDLGMLLGAQSAAAQAWAEFVKALICVQRRPMALVPLGTGQLGAPVPPSLPILRWSPDARPRPIRIHGKAAPQPDGLDDLLAMVAATRRVDPPLLRAMRRLGPRAPLNAGLEGALWCHADVVAVHTASIKAQARKPYLDHFAGQLKSLHAELDHQRCRHHAHLRAVINHEETLLWAAQAEEEAIARSPGAAERVEQAQEFMRRLVATLTRPEAQSSPAWWNVAHGIVQRADARMWRKYSSELHRLLALQLRGLGATQNIPKHADQGVLAGLIDPDQPVIACWLVQDAASGCLVLQSAPAGARQVAMGEPLPLDAGGARISVTRTDRAWLSPEALPVRLARLSEPVKMHLQTARESVLVAPVRRPRGALGWGCDRDGIAVRSAPFGPWEMSWSGTMLHAVPPAEGEQGAALWGLQADAVSHPDSQGALQFGIESRFGIDADLTIATEHGSASQRLRWIEPGSFLMGSPPTEAGRFDHEGPQHEVVISNGFWLFDTPCTQALWQAVMGDNPSFFKSPDRPVETVSWDDVQEFLKRINARVPGLDLVLPMEAEWEYACRAGTETAIYAGDLEILGASNAPALDPIAWYGGNSGVGFDLDNGLDSSDWPEKQYPHTRAGTHPVGLKEPNAWGLYDMLGNVWEWCADGQRGYTAEAVTDPVGPTRAGAERVLRGGSWGYYAQDVRSASRDAFHPYPISNFIGFRCARVQESREPASGPEAPKKKVRRRGRSKPRDAAA